MWEPLALASGVAAAEEAVVEGVVAVEDRDQAGLAGLVKVEAKAGLQLSSGGFWPLLASFCTCHETQFPVNPF